MDNENKKLTPMKFVPQVQEMPWGVAEYKLADLGFVDSLSCDGWLKGNTLGDIMQTYLERVVGETSFEWNGTQFPVLVKRLTVKGRTSLHVNPDDETAAQRYDAFGKTALWYVREAGPLSRLYLGFKRPVSAREFYLACEQGRVEELLHVAKPKAGELYLIPPGMVHAAKDVTLEEVAESSELSFRLHDWEKTGRELHLEEAFDLIDWGRSLAAPCGPEVLIPQFTAHVLELPEALKSHRDADDTFLLYLCLEGEALLQADSVNYALGSGEVILVPAEVNDFFLVPARKGTSLLEVRVDPRPQEEPVTSPEEES